MAMERDPLLPCTTDPCEGLDVVQYKTQTVIVSRQLRRGRCSSQDLGSDQACVVGR
jgi:hypothetical protein